MRVEDGLDVVTVERVEGVVDVIDGRPEAGISLHVGVEGERHETAGLLAHAFDEPAQTRVERGAVDPTGRLGHVHHEVAGSFEFAGEPHRGDDRTEIGGHGLLTGEQVVALLLDAKGERVEFIVGLDELEGATHVVAQEHLGATWDELGDERAELHDLVADFVESLMERHPLFGHGVRSPISRNGR